MGRIFDLYFQAFSAYYYYRLTWRGRGMSCIVRKQGVWDGFTLWKWHG